LRKREKAQAPFFPSILIVLDFYVGLVIFNFIKELKMRGDEQLRAKISVTGWEDEE
jgi:hypothetical protein